MISINLLPPAIKESQAYARRNSRLVGLLMMTLILAGAIYGGLTGLWLWLDYRNGTLTRELDQKGQVVASYSDIEQKAGEIAKKLDTIDRALTLQPQWKKAIEEIAFARPNGVKIVSFSLDSNSLIRVSTAGHADSISQIGQFKKALDASARFENTDIASIGITGEGYSFTVTTSLRRGALR